MQSPSYALISLLVVVSTCAAKDRVKTTVRAISHESQTYQRTMTYTTPGTATTNCAGTASSAGNTTTGIANCQTTSMPAQNHLVTTNVSYVTNVVESNGLRYVITCRAGWVGSNCRPMHDGDLFPAEIQGTTIWIEARKGGNQGKKVRVKYKVLDIRPIAEVR